MRYIPNTYGGSSKFNDGARPPLDLLPKDLVAKLREHDRIMAQRSEAQALLNDLSTPQVQHAADQTDDQAASEAARAGKRVPAPTAGPKLQADIAAAQHALNAQNAAFVAVTAELDYLVSDLFWSGADEAAAERAKVREVISAKADEFADLVEEAVNKSSVRDWLRTGAYHRDAMTWPTEFVDLQRHGLSRKTTTPVFVRNVIKAAALAVLAEVDSE